MRCTDELHATLGDGTGGFCFQFPSDFIDDNCFRIVIFYPFDHYLVLQGWRTNLHAPGASHSGMGHIAIAANFIGGIDDDHALALCQQAGCLAQHGGLAYSGASQDKQAFTTLDQIFDDIRSAVYSSSYPAGETYNSPPAVADSGDTVKCPFQTSPVIGIEHADPLDYIIDILSGDFCLSQHYFA